MLFSERDNTGEKALFVFSKQRRLNKVPLSGVRSGNKSYRQHNDILLVSVDMIQHVAKVRKSVIVAYRDQHVPGASMDSLQCDVRFKRQPELVERPDRPVGLALIYAL